MLLSVVLIKGDVDEVQIIVVLEDKEGALKVALLAIAKSTVIADAVDGDIFGMTSLTIMSLEIKCSRMTSQLSQSPWGAKRFGKGRSEQVLARLLIEVLPLAGR